VSDKKPSVFLTIVSCTCSAIGAAGFILLTFFTCVVIIVLTYFNAQTMIDWIAIRWGRGSNWLFRLDVRVSGLENLPVEGCLFVFNHTSHLDVTTIHGFIPKPLRFGAKIELFKIPVFGRTLRLAGILPIERRNRGEVFKVYAEAQKRIANGESFVLAPEGTRQDGTTLGTFKSGPFVLAINSEAMIVPIVLKGLSKAYSKDNILPSCGVWKPPVELIVLPGTETKNLSLDDRADLQESIRNQMLAVYHSGTKKKL
jgi:1-acyl-sn-glycerol-3-phosphate acyltransferase